MNGRVTEIGTGALGENILSWAATHARERAAEGGDEPLDITLVVVHMRADAHAPKPRGHVDVLGGQALDQKIGLALAEAETQDVGSAYARIGYRDVGVAKAISEAGS